VKEEKYQNLNVHRQFFILQKVRPKPEAGTSVLVHHGDLIHEAIECMKSNRWMIKEKEIALGTALELVRLPPFVPQMTR